MTCKCLKINSVAYLYAVTGCEKPLKYKSSTWSLHNQILWFVVALKVKWHYPCIKALWLEVSITEPGHRKIYKQTYVPSKDWDQPVHLPSMINSMHGTLWHLLPGPKASKCWQWRLWSERADMQADMMSAGNTCQFVGFAVPWLNWCRSGQTC